MSYSARDRTMFVKHCWSLTVHVLLIVLMLVRSCCSFLHLFGTLFFGCGSLSAASNLHVLWQHECSVICHANTRGWRVGGGGGGGGGRQAGLTLRRTICCPGLTERNKQGEMKKKSVRKRGRTIRRYEITKKKYIYIHLLTLLFKSNSKLFLSSLSLSLVRWFINTLSMYSHSINTENTNTLSWLKSYHLNN